MKRETRNACAVLLAALFLRVLVFLSAARRPDSFFTPDAHQYRRLALNLQAGHGFSERASPPYDPCLKRTPLFPLWLAFCYGLFGRGPHAPVMAQCLAGSCACLGLYRMLARALGERRAFVAGVLLAVDPVTVGYTNLLLTETMYTLLLLMGVWCLYAAVHAAGCRYWILAGGMLGLAALCRPVGILFLPAVLSLLLIRGARQIMASGAGPIRAFRNPACFAAAFSCCILPWVIRGVRVTGKPVFSTIGAYNLVAYRTAGIRADAEHRPLSDLRAECLAEWGMDEAGFSGTKAVRMFVGESCRHPWIAMKMFAVEWMGIFVYPARSDVLPLLGIAYRETPRTGPGSRSWMARIRAFVASGVLERLVCGVQMIFATAVFATACYGWRIGRRRYPWMDALVLGMALFAAVHAGPEATARFRVPLMPFLCALSAVGLCGRSDDVLPRPSGGPAGA